MEGMTVPLFPPAPWSWAIAVPSVIGAAAWALRLVRRSAFVAGVPLGILVFRFGGLSGFLVLTAFFLLGTALTKLGFSAKAAKGVAEASGGRRGASHVLANCGVGLLVLALRAILQRSSAEPSLLDLLWVAYAGSFATAASDTSSSEIGQLVGRHPVSPRTLRPVPVGTQGAVSLEGLAAGLAAAGAMGAVGWATRLLDGPDAAAVTLGGFLGNVLESVAGTWGRRALPHGLLNFANTAVGAALALGLASLF